jgi:hypothetical protein
LVEHAPRKGGVIGSSPISGFTEETASTARIRAPSSVLTPVKLPGRGIAVMLGWVLSRIKGAFNSWVEGLLVVAAGIVILALWGARDELPAEVTLPLWLLTLVIALPGVLALILLVRAWRQRQGAPVDVLRAQLALTAYYSQHLHDALETLQKVLTGTIPGVPGLSRRRS